MTAPKLKYQLNAASYFEPPYVERCFEQYPEKCSNPGIDVLYLLRVLHNVAIDLRYFHMEEDDLLPAILNGSIDIFLQTESSKYDEYAFTLDASSYIAVERPAFYVRKTIVIQDKFSMFAIFDWLIWAVCFFCFVATYITIYLAKLIVKKFMPASKHYATHIFSSGKFAEFLCFLTLCVLLNVYANILAIGLANQVTVTDAPFHDLESFAKLWHDGICHVMTYDYMIDEYPAIFPDSNSSELTEIEQMLVEAKTLHPPILVDSDDYQEFLLWIVGNDSQCLVQVDYETRWHFFRTVVGDQLTRVLDTHGTQEPYVYFYRKNLNTEVKHLLRLAFAAGSHPDDYDRTIARMAGSGMLSAKGEKLNFSTTEPPEPLTALSLANFETPLTIFVISALISAIILLFEIFKAWRKSRQRVVKSTLMDRLPSTIQTEISVKSSSMTPQASVKTANGQDDVRRAHARPSLPSVPGKSFGRGMYSWHFRLEDSNHMNTV